MITENITELISYTHHMSTAAFTTVTDSSTAEGSTPDCDNKLNQSHDQHQTVQTQEYSVNLKLYKIHPL